MSKPQTHCLEPQASLLKQARKPRSITLVIEHCKGDSTHQPGRRARKATKQPDRNFDVAVMDMSRVSKRINKKPSTQSSSNARVGSQSTSEIPSELTTRKTKSGRESKAKKGVPVHNCDKCGKVKSTLWTTRLMGGNG